MSREMIHLPQEVVEHMRANCPGRTDEALRRRFGISYNTWRKIERGGALRLSLGQRIVHRVEAELASD